MHFSKFSSEKAETRLDRRSFLRMNLFAAAALALPSSAMALVPDRKPEERVLTFYNTHTGERLKNAVYWSKGHYVRETLQDINHILRDFRQDEIKPIDPALLDLLHELRHELDLSATKPLHIISGYRSPATNQLLSRQSGGVAKRSLHMDGMAIDIRVPGLRTASLHRAAVGLNRGGVGLYENSSFVHLDIGPVRHW